MYSLFRTSRLRTLSFFSTFVFTQFALAQLAFGIDLKIGIASKSFVKKEATQVGFQTVFPKGTLTFHNYSANSKIAEQPVSEKSGILGAQNRLSDALTESSLDGTMDYWVSIENYIEPAPQYPGKWVDKAVVLLQKKNRPLVVELSEPVFFDEKYSKLAQAKTDASYSFNDTGYSVTVGKLISEEYVTKGIQLPHDNWHQHPDFGNVSRQTLIERALVRAIFKADIDLVPDFPKQGIQFRDLSPLLQNPEVFRAALRTLSQKYRSVNIDMIAALDARGFLIGPTLALQLNKPFAMIRKKGKLPNVTFSKEYGTEYSKDEIEISVSHLDGKRVLIVDDLLATGGTLNAAIDLFKEAGAGEILTTCFIELLDLKGREALRAPFFSLVQY